MIKIHTLGGYSEVGRNMTAVQVEDEIIVLDMGIHLDPYIKMQESDPFGNPTAEELHEAGAIPDDSKLEKDKVVAIIPSHAHLDHIGAIPYMEKEYNAKILCTPFCKELLKILAKDKHIDLKNKVKALKAGQTFKTKHTTIEFIPITHSTIQTVIVAIHTKEGTILYANDFKVDMSPTFGNKPDFSSLKKKKVLAMICDCIYADEEINTPSESVAKDMLEEVFDSHNFNNKAIIISTFSSHIARLQSIVRCAKKIKRKIIFLGRSLAKYVEAAENAGIIAIPKDVEIVKYRKQIIKRLKEISNTKDEYVIVATGHQGEPNAVLSKMANEQLPFKLEKEDVIIFSSTVIPVEQNEKNSAVLERMLHEKGVTIFRDIHVSGHAAGKDLKALIKEISPQHIIPAHGPTEMQEHLIKIAKELKYSDEFLHKSNNGDIIIIQ
jgi:ribonuclease J